jgi:hypothetical protein
MGVIGPGCVKTRMSQERAGLFSLLSFVPDDGSQAFSFQADEIEKDFLRVI